jgi:hypothetical protein
VKEGGLWLTGEEKDPIRGSGKELVVARELDARAGLRLELRDGDATLRRSWQHDNVTTLQRDNVTALHRYTVTPLHRYNVRTLQPSTPYDTIGKTCATLNPHNKHVAS